MKITIQKGLMYLHLLIWLPVTLGILLVMPVRDALIEWFGSLIDGVEVVIESYTIALKHISSLGKPKPLVMPEINQWDAS